VVSRQGSNAGCALQWPRRAVNDVSPVKTSLHAKELFIISV
jgi:hypothetical protein